MDTRTTRDEPLRGILAALPDEYSARPADSRALHRAIAKRWPARLPRPDPRELVDDIRSIRHVETAARTAAAPLAPGNGDEPAHETRGTDSASNWTHDAYTVPPTVDTRERRRT